MKEPGPCVDDQLGLAIGAALRDIDLAGQDDKGARRDFAGGEDVAAGRIGSAFPKPRNAVDLCRLQHRKHLVAAGFDRYV